MLEVNVLRAFLLALPYPGDVQVKLLTLWEVLAAVTALISLTVDLAHVLSQLRFLLEVHAI